MKNKVLFLCVHNSSRSQMTEAFLKKYGGENFFVESAGLEKDKINPLAVEIMKEEGIDISKNETKDVFDFFKEGKIYHYVITVCDKKASERCPVFPGLKEKINWEFDNPSQFTGSHNERLAKIRVVRNRIKEAVIKFIEHVSIESNK